MTKEKYAILKVPLYRVEILAEGANSKEFYVVGRNFTEAIGVSGKDWRSEKLGIGETLDIRVTKMDDLLYLPESFLDELQDKQKEKDKK